MNLRKEFKGDRNDFSENCQVREFFSSGTRPLEAEACRRKIIQLTVCIDAGIEVGFHCFSHNFNMIFA